ncbi:MAG TPA: Hsp20/alpha crystallin family protein [Bacteriovoracaceae bacterium]|nr:Hsp20/alpha crystallin family protein [Bacteriovoracaceae bacterium]
MNPNSPTVSEFEGDNEAEVLKTIIDSAFENRKLEILTPKIEWKDLGNHYLLTAELPGMSIKDIKVLLTDNMLFLEGDRRAQVEPPVTTSEISYGSFRRAIPLFDDIDRSEVKASYKNGMLQVQLLRKSPV